MDGEAEKKRCSKCGQAFPATPEFFYRAKDKQGNPILYSSCKTCKQAQNKVTYGKPEVRQKILAREKEKYATSPEVREKQRIRKQQPAYREKKRASERMYRNRPEVKERRRAYSAVYRSRPDARERKRIVTKLYWQKPEVLARKREQWRRSIEIPERREREQARLKIYRHSERGRQYRLAYAKKYKNRPIAQERWRLRAHRRRALRKSVNGDYTVAQIQEQLKRQGYCCYYAACGFSKFEKKDGKYIYHIDHTFPLSRVAGTDTPANDISYLVLACPSCNLSKGDKFPWEWPEGGRLL